MTIDPTRPSGAGSERCTVCDHTAAEHDPISVRYCNATQAQALGRGCICAPRANPGR